MTSIFREVPSHFYYLVFSSKEDDLSQEYHEPPCKVIKYANETHQSKLPGSLCRFLKGLLNSTHCEYSIRCHHNIDKAETEEVCSKFVGEHYHLTLYLKSFVGAEAFIKETISNHIISPPKRLQNKKLSCSINESFISRKLFAIRGETGWESFTYSG